ncbi:MAG: hypothetical protein AB7F59_00615 [Bdellovibrionales bacterium]
MNCPKCGFDQPQDRFCAQCGVDVSLYRGSAVPHFLTSKTFLIGLPAVLICICIVVILIKISTPSNNIQAVSPAQTATPTPQANNIPAERPVTTTSTTSTQTPTPAPPPAPTPANTLPEAAPTEDSPVGFSETASTEALAPTTETAVSATPPAKTENAQPAATKWTPTNFRLSFYEVNYDIFQAALGTIASDQPIIGVIRLEANQNTAEDKFRTFNTSIDKHGSVQQKISFDEQSPNEFNFLSYDQRIHSEIGLSLQIRANTPAETGMNLALEGRRLIGKPNTTQVESISLSRDLAVSPKSAIYITGLLENRPPVSQNELQSFLSNQFLSIYRSERFQNKQSGLVIILEVESAK